MPNTNHRSILAVLPCLLFLGGCGGKMEGIRPSSEFTEQHAESFDDGIDLVREPGMLEGQWFKDWQSDLKKRVELSDFVAVVAVNVLRTDVDLDRTTSFRLVTTVDRVLKGVSPGSELALIVHESQDGYASVEDNQANVLNRQFVAYVKWYEDENGGVAGHWHLSPASQAVVIRTEEIIQENLDAKRLRRRVIVHRDKY